MAKSTQYTDICLNGRIYQCGATFKTIPTMVDTTVEQDTYPRKIPGPDKMEVIIQSRGFCCEVEKYMTHGEIFFVIGDKQIHGNVVDICMCNCYIDVIDVKDYIGE